MSEITYSRLVREDLERIGEIDRTERIDTLYVQHGDRLDRRFGDFSAPAWFTEGDGEHSVAHQRAECERHLAAGGIALGAFANGQLVAIGIVRPRPARQSAASTTSVVGQLDTRPSSTEPRVR